MDYETGLAAARELEAALPAGVSLPAATLAWIASQPGVASVIPGARNTRQAEANAAAAALVGDGALAGFDDAVHRVYDEKLRASIHPQW